MNAIQILLAIETPLIGNIVASVLQDQPDMQVAGCVDSLADALSFVEQNKVDMALVSVGLAEQGALALTRTLVERGQPIKVLALGLAEDDRNEALRYIEAGVCGYILKDSSLPEFLQIIRLAQRGEAQVSAKMAGAMMQRLASLARRFSTVETQMDRDARLTSRELEVLRCISQGLTNQQIAARLVVEVGTVKNHVHRILEKLNVHTRDEAASYLAFMRR